MVRTRKLRLGFTLVELLVSLAIIGLMVGLLIPAVQAIRESARRSQCRSNLRDLGLAAQNFVTTYRQLPTGGWGYQWQGFADVGTLQKQPGSWTYSLLPFLEQGSLYSLGRYRDPVAQRDQDLRERLLTPVPEYNCPSRRLGRPFQFAADCPSCAVPIGVSGPLTGTVRGDYASNAGDGKPNPQKLDSWPLDFWGPAGMDEAIQLRRSGRWPTPPSDWSGISWLGQGVRMAAISDGTSHTILYGEKYVPQDEYESGTDWGDNEPLYGGFNNDNHRSTNPFWRLRRDQEGVMSIGSFGSAHPSATHFVMVDGSVQSLGYTVDRRIYRYLGNRHDGQPVELQK